MISFLQFLVNDLAVVHTEGNGWLRDMNWGGIPEGKAREERDLRAGLGTAGGPSAEAEFPPAAETLASEVA